jgi:parallel beta-helix repeat protein
MRKLRSGVMLALLLACTLALTFRIQPARSSPGTITVPDDYPTIQAAVDAASPGDTVFVRAGTYNCSIKIDKPLTLKGESNQNTILRAQARTIGLHVNASDVTVSGFHLISPIVGDKAILIVVDGRSNVTGDNCVIKDNVLEEYGTDALTLIGSNGDEVVGNVISSQHGTCTLLFSSSNCLIRNNSLSGSEWTGIALLSSSNNTVSNNFITNQIDSNGLQCGAVTLGTSSKSNTVTGNTLVNNEYGVTCWQLTQNNVIYHNNFVNNTHQSYSVESLARNLWDNGYPSGGNYWSDYNGTDLYSGPYQNETGSDGKGDTPYVIDANNRDNYPLMGLFPARGDINGDGVVDGSDLIIIARAFGSYGPNYLYPGSPQHPRWNPDADINSDGVVDGSDIILTTRMFGHH